MVARYEWPSSRKRSLVFEGNVILAAGDAKNSDVAADCPILHDMWPGEVYVMACRACSRSTLENWNLKAYMSYYNRRKFGGDKFLDSSDTKTTLLPRKDLLPVQTPMGAVKHDIADKCNIGLWFFSVLEIISLFVVNLRGMLIHLYQRYLTASH